MWYRTSLILFAAGLTGCGVLALNSNIEIAQRHDISTGDDTVEIRGSKKGAVERETCHIVRPAFSMALIADAGQVSFIVGCSVVDIVMGVRYGYNYAAVEFVAEAGHTYRFNRTSSGLKGFRGVDVVDISDKRRFIVRSPLRSVTNDANRIISQAFVFAVSDTFATTNTVCQINDANPQQFFKPGEITITVRCTDWSSSFGPLKSKVKGAFESKIVLEAEAGHLYSLSMPDIEAQCIQVTDVTSDELRPLVCHPVVALDEQLGKTRVELCAGPKTKCREMTSCAEARKYMKCGLIGLDGDFDGVPCDSICK